MKKCLLSLTLLFATFTFTIEVKAQTQLKFGARLGFNFETFRYSKDQDDPRSPRISLLGVYAVVPIYETFSIQPEVLAAQRGAKINNVSINLSYIQIPLFARVDFANESLLSPHVYLGPYIGFNIDVEENDNPTFIGNIPTAGNTALAEERVNKVVYGLAVGLGVDISRISFGIRFSQGLTNIYETEEARNTAISIVASFRF